MLHQMMSLRLSDVVQHTKSRVLKSYEVKKKDCFNSSVFLRDIAFENNIEAKK